MLVTKCKLLVLAANDRSAVTMQILEFETPEEADRCALTIHDYDESESYFKVEAIKLYGPTR